MFDESKTGGEEMSNVNPDGVSKFDEAFQIFKSLNPDFQAYALDQIRSLLELQRELT